MEPYIYGFDRDKITDSDKFQKKTQAQHELDAT